MNTHNLRQRLKKSKRNIKRRTNNTTERTLKDMRADARANLAGDGSIYLGTTMRSFTIRHAPGGPFEQWRLVNTSPHAKYLEYGTGRKNIGTRMDQRFESPPLTGRLINEIRAWMILKPVAPRYELNRSAYLIARELSQAGQNPKPFMHPAYMRQIPTYKVRMKYAIRRAL